MLDGIKTVTGDQGNPADLDKKRTFRPPAQSTIVKFKHDDTLPLPDDPAGQCDPTIVPPKIASTDGLPYYAGRWAYQTVPKYIKKAAGIDHISIDFNPCGHPPFNVFTVPHYDFHIYKVDPEYRTCMTCVQPIGAPICDPSPDAQTTSNGLGEFV